MRTFTIDSTRLYDSAIVWSCPATDGGDTGITNQIDRWLDQRPTNKLVLLHERPKELVERSPILGRSYDDLTKRRQLILIRNWMCNTALAGIRPALCES